MKSIITLLFLVDLTLGAQTSVFGLGKNDLVVSAGLKSLLILAAYLLFLKHHGRHCLGASDILTLKRAASLWAAIATVAMLVGLAQPDVSLRYLIGDYYKYLLVATLLPLFYLGIRTRLDIEALIERVVVLFTLTALIFLGLFGLGVVRIYTITPPGLYVPLIAPILLSKATTNNPRRIQAFARLGLAEAIGLLYCSQSLLLVVTTVIAGSAYLILSKRVPLWSVLAGTGTAFLFGLYLCSFPHAVSALGDHAQEYILERRPSDMHIMQKFRLLLSTNMTPRSIADSLGGGRTGEILGLIEYFQEHPTRVLIGAGMGSFPHRVATKLNPNPLRTHSSESTYCETLYRTGLAGFCVLLWLQLIFMKRAMRLSRLASCEKWKSATNQDTHEVAATAFAFGCGLTVGYFMGFWIAQPLLMWFLLLVAVFAPVRQALYCRAPRRMRLSPYIHATS